MSKALQKSKRLNSGTNASNAKSASKVSVSAQSQPNQSAST